MRLTAEQLAAEGDEGGLIQLIEKVFFALHCPDRVGVAVSGGGDSMALLHLAWRWSVLSGVPIEAVTVDHGLRPAAVQEAKMVATYCATLDVPHTTLQWDGRSAKGNIAAAGRDARYRMIGAWAQEQGIAGVVLGHTVDDIAETFLMRLARKSGVDGLSMMDIWFDRDGIRWGRPLWQEPRAALRAYLTRHEIEWVDDPTNDDHTYERPKARKILAALDPLGIDADVLKSVAMNMTSAQTTLEHYAAQEAHRVLHQDRGDIVLQSPAAPPVPLEIERRLMVAALRFVSGSAYAPRTDSVQGLYIGLALVKKHTLAGCLVTSDTNGIRVTREYNAVKNTTCATDQIWDSRWVLDGLHAPNLTIRALGEHIKDVPDWRESSLPRASLLATPAVFDGDTLIAAPVAGLQNGFSARIVADFTSFLLSR